MSRLSALTPTYSVPVEIHIMVSAEQYEALAEIAKTLPLPEGDKSVQLALDAMIADWQKWHNQDGTEIEAVSFDAGGNE